MGKLVICYVWHDSEEHYEWSDYYDSIEEFYNSQPEAEIIYYFNKSGAEQLLGERK